MIKLHSEQHRICLIDNILNYVPDINNDKLERIQQVMDAEISKEQHKRND